MSNRGKKQINLLDWSKGLENWNKLAVAIFGLTCVATVWLLGTVASLNMLPFIYLAVIILLVALFLFGVFKGLFIAGFDKKKKPKKKAKDVVVIRLVGLVLAL